MTVLTLHIREEFAGCHLSRFIFTVQRSLLLGSLGNENILQPFLAWFVHSGTQQPGILPVLRSVENWERANAAPRTCNGLRGSGVGSNMAAVLAEAAFTPAKKGTTLHGGGARSH